MLMMRSSLGAIVAMSVLVTAVLGTTTPADAASRVTYYVAVGDSAAAGFQPTGQTERGYANQLYNRVHATSRFLRLEKLGCPGETTETLISGDGSPCTYPSGSQLAEAKAFLSAHAGQIAFITIDVGVNDVLDQCLNDFSGLIDPACVRGALPAVQANLAFILRSLRAGAVRVPIAGMSYWDPFLGYWIAGGPGHFVAHTDAQSMAELNAGLIAMFRHEGALVADVGGPDYFHVGDFSDMVPTRWGRVPVNVANACRWTWFCSDPPFTGDPHPNTKGYSVIADAFEAVLPV
jgi:lysophospholipase L1-like esterase